MKRKTVKNLMSVIASLALAAALMSAAIVGALADTGVYKARLAGESPFASMVNNPNKTVKFNGMDWYVIADDSGSDSPGTVTLLKKDMLGDGGVVFDSSGLDYNDYAKSSVRQMLDAETAEVGRFKAVADAIAATDLPDVGVTGARLYLLSEGEAERLNNGISEHATSWWTRTKEDNPYSAFARVLVMKGGSSPGSEYAEVDMKYGLRPALRIDLAKAVFDSETLTFKAKASVTGVTLDKTAITLAADGTETLTATVSPAATENTIVDASVTWTSSNERVATVDQKGKVTAVAPGEATITATATNGTDTADDDKTATCSVIVPMKVAVPGIASKAYTGALQTADVPESEFYTVAKNEGGVDVGEYDVVLALNDPAKYTWADSAGAEKTLKFEITRPFHNIVTVSMEGWTYGEQAKEPTFTATFGTPTFSYGKAQDGPFTADKPTEAGIWYVRADVAETANYPSGGATTLFEIAKVPCPVRVTESATVKAGGSINLADYVDMNGTNWPVAFSKEDAGDGCSISGSTFTAGQDVPESPVEVKVSVEGDANHAGLEATIMVTVTSKIVLTISAEDVETTYSEGGTVTIAATVTGADPEKPYGVLSFATDPPTGNEYLESDENMSNTLKILKAGTTYVVVGVGENDYYAAVHEDVKVTIKKASIEPSVAIEDWTYGEEANEPALGEGSNPGGGEVAFEYKAKDADESAYSAEKPTSAGDYTVRVTVAETDNYLSGVATADFTIVKAAVAAPEIAGKAYTGGRQTADVPESDLYTVTANEGGTDAGEYDVVLTLKDPVNYKWADGDGATKTLKFRIAAPVPAPETSEGGATEPASGSDSAPDEVVETFEAGSGDSAASYDLMGDGTVWLKKAKSVKKAKKIKVLATVERDGKACRVVGISKGAFKNCKKLAKVTIGKNVREIGSKAFYGCKKLTKLTVPAGVTKIGASAFAKSGVKTLTIKSKKLTTKASVTNMLKGSKVKTVKTKSAKVRKAIKKYAGKKGVKVK